MTARKPKSKMAEVADTNLEPRDIPLNDPGGAHAKGYSADPQAPVQVQPTGPIPLASVADDESQVHQPEREGKVQPTGRSDGGAYTPNERLMGSDR